jgi:hypothetical protein
MSKSRSIKSSIFDHLVISIFDVEEYEIIIIQDPNGNLINIKTNYYE